MIHPCASLRAVAIAIVVAMSLSACDDTPIAPPTTTVTVPNAYAFESRFVSGVSSVSYEGQVVRNLLIQDLTTAIAALAKPGAAPVIESDLLRLYEHVDANNLTTTTSIAGRTPLETRYSSIATNKNLSGKVSSAQVIGMNGTPDALIRGWIRTVATNAQDPAKLGTPLVLLDENGIDIAEILNKVLLGSLSYYQATSGYLAGVLNQSNDTAARDGAGAKLAFTSMEHSWDEAFGYFGAARDFKRYSDADLAGTSAAYTYDSDGDGKIDFRSEYNYSFARYAGRRDRSAGTDFTKDIFDAFLAGRTAIVNRGTIDQITQHRRSVSIAWERILAATVGHYMNDVEETMRTLDTTSTAIASLRHQWAEMKGYAITLQFNSMKSISDADLIQLHTLIGDSPVVAGVASNEHTAYLLSIDAARAIIKRVYGFSDDQMSLW